MSFENTKKPEIFGAPKNLTFFEREKKQSLRKIDKSSAGVIDRAILPLVNKMNRYNDYYTTSSCAGRIVLVKETGEKQENAFLFKKHEKTGFEEIREALISAADRYNGKIYLRMEPCILHVACGDFDKAVSLVDKARQAGWKKSGIISKRNIVEMLSTEIFSAIVANKGKVLVSEDYLKIIINECNQKLIQTRAKIKKMEGVI